MFYLVEIAEGDSKIAGRAVYGYETEDLAVATFHTKLGQAMKSELFTSELCIVIDADGKVIKREKWVKPVEE